MISCIIYRTFILGCLPSAFNAYTIQYTPFDLSLLRVFPTLPCSMRLSPPDHLLAHPAIAHVGVLVHLDLSAPLAEQVLDGGDVARGDGAGLGAEGVADEEVEFGAR